MLWKSGSMVIFLAERLEQLHLSCENGHRFSNFRIDALDKQTVDVSSMYILTSERGSPSSTEAVQPRSPRSQEVLTRAESKMKR